MRFASERLEWRNSDGGGPDGGCGCNGSDLRFGSAPVETPDRPRAGRSERKCPVPPAPPVLHSSEAMHRQPPAPSFSRFCCPRFLPCTLQMYVVDAVARPVTSGRVIAGREGLRLDLPVER